MFIKKFNKMNFGTSRLMHMHTVWYPFCYRLVNNCFIFVNQLPPRQSMQWTRLLWTGTWYGFDQCKQKNWTLTLAVKIFLLMFKQITIMCIQLQYKCEIMDMCTYYHYTSNLQNIAFWAKTSISIYVTIQTTYLFN
jgi:hypothetical protein